LWERSPFPRWDQLFSLLLRKSFSRGNSEEFTHKNLFYLFSRVNTIGATLTGWKFFNQMIGRIIVQRKTSHGREKNVTLSHFTAIWRRWAAQKSPKFGQLTSNRKKILVATLCRGTTRKIVLLPPRLGRRRRGDTDNTQESRVKI
jgi:hypothetical protein